MSENLVMSKGKDPFALYSSSGRKKNAEWVQKYFNELIIPHMDKEKIIANGLKVVQNYSWEIITKEYYEKIYSKLL